MIYFQSILALYESTTEERKKNVVNQLVTYADTNKQHESFFQFLYEQMETPVSLSPTTLNSILNISIDFLNSQNPNFSVSNIKQFVLYLLRLFSLNTQPYSYEKYNDFLRTAFRLINQYNQESFYSALSRIPYEHSIVPLSVLCIQNTYFFDRILKILDQSFANFKKEQKLSIWTIAMANLLQNVDNNHKDDENNAVNKSISLILNKVFVNKFLSLDRKFNLLESSLHYLPTKLGDDLLSSHCLNLLSSVSISSSIDEIIIAVNFAKTVLIHLKQSTVKNLTTNQLIDAVFMSILPSYRSGHILNASLTDFFKEVDQEYLQSKINAELHSESSLLSTLFLISRFPTQKTIPHLLTRAKVDPKSQYSMIFHFLSHNLVPFRYLPRLFSILEPADLHFLNEILEQKPFLYCTAAVKFLSQCRRVEKIEFIATLFSQSEKPIPIVKSPYAVQAFIRVACLRAQSKEANCPIRLLLDYINDCIKSSRNQKVELKNLKESSQKVDDKSVAENEKQKGEIAEDNEDENEQSTSSIKSPHSKKEGSDDEIETAQIKTSEISNSLSQNIQEMNSISSSPSSLQFFDQLDLTNEDIEMITNASKSDNLSSNFYDVKKNSEELNRPSFCQSRSIRSMVSSDPELKEEMINESLNLLKEGDPIFTIIIGSLTDDKILIHNCVQTLAQSNLFLLTFFFTTAASCNSEIILNEICEYINKEPEAAPQSFIARLFNAKASTLSRRQRIARRCIIGIAPFVPFSNQLYQTLLLSFPSDSIDNSSSSSRSSPLVCESIISVCSRMENKEDLHLILQKLISKSDYLEPNLLVKALTSILKSNKVLSNKDALSVVKLWINLVASNKVLIDSTSKKNQNQQSFESVLLANENAKNIYMKEIEDAIKVNGDNPSLFCSFKEALPFIKGFDLSKKPSLLTLIISNCLSEKEVVLQFCVSLLRETFQLNYSLNPLKGVVFSNEYVESVRHFFTELSMKFQSKQLIQLVEALLTYYKEKEPRHQESIFLFTVFAILKQPLLFVQNKFISKIAKACDKMNKKNSYAIMFYLCRAFDAMNISDKSLFFKELIVVPDNEFIATYIEKYSSYYEILEPLLIPRILELRTINKKWRELLEFERLLKLFNGFVRLSFRNSSSSEKKSRIIFSLLLSVSTINFIRNRGFSIDSYLTIIEQTFIEFKNLTGLCLISSNSMNSQVRLILKNDNDFYEFVSGFALSFQYLNFDVVRILLSLLESLISTIHSDCALLCLSSYLVTISSSSSSSFVSDDTKRMKTKAVDLFTNLLKNCKFDSNLISFVVSKVPSAFSVTTLKQMNESYLAIFLKTSLDGAIKAVDSTQPLELVLNIVRSSTPSFISQFVSQIIDALRSIVSAGKAKLFSILVLNIIGEIGRRKQDPSVLLKDSSISFRSLVPYLLSDDGEVKNRVMAIFSLMIFGRAEQKPDFELIFASLMSIFVGYENDTSSYVAIASDLLKSIEKSNKADIESLKLLKFAFQPVLSVGDANCNEAISELLKYLKKLTSVVDDKELFEYSLGMMTLFARPKRNFSLSNK